MSDASPVSYPEHEKLALIQPLSQAIGEFVVWLREQSMIICMWNEFRQEWVPVATSIDKLMARHFDIDLDRLEAEKRDMIARMSQPTPPPD